MTHYIYKITNLINNKIYIGQSKNPKSRWSCHKSHSKDRLDTAIDRAIAKYGVDNFSFEIIFSCISLGNVQLDQNLADEMEIQIIAQEKSQTINNIGYNISPGGTNGRIVSDDTKRKISEARKGSHVSLEARLKISNFQKGKLKSDDHKNKIGKSQDWRAQEIRNLCISAITSLKKATYSEICCFKNENKNLTRTKINCAIIHLCKNEMIQKHFPLNELIFFTLKESNL